MMAEPIELLSDLNRWPDMPKPNLYDAGGTLIVLESK